MAKRPRPRQMRSAAPPARRQRPEIVHSSVYLPRLVWRALREIALERDEKVHDLILDGIDSVLKRHGRPSVADLRYNEGD